MFTSNSSKDFGDSILDVLHSTQKIQPVDITLRSRFDISPDVAFYADNLQHDSSYAVSDLIKRTRQTAMIKCVAVADQDGAND